MREKRKLINVGLVVLIALLLGVSLPLINEGVHAKNLCQCEGGIMKPDSETLQKWIEYYNSAPFGKQQLGEISRGSVSLLDHLEYTPGNRNQGDCGNCWVWAGTGVLGIALDVQKRIKDRLSVQYFTSCWPGDDERECACCGGWLNEFANWYQSNGYIIPWSNDNAGWQDENRHYYYVDDRCECDDTAVPCEDISTSFIYPITSCDVMGIETHGVGQETAIAEIKSNLNQNKPIWFVFALPNEDDWTNFNDFWHDEPESTSWNPDFACGHAWDKDQGGMHAVLCVGYDDTYPSNSYWVMLNSWGDPAGRPKGLFRVNMSMNYDCTFPNPNGNVHGSYWQYLDVNFDMPRSIDLLSPTQSSPASAGAYDYPSHIYDVTVEVKEGTTPVTGLTNADFSFEIGDKPATATLTDVSTPGKYVFDVTPPHQDAAGKYDFEVALKSNYNKDCTFGDREEEAVIYTKGAHADVMLIIDRSGSMRWSSPAIEDAKESAKLFVDYMRYDDRAGVVSFETSASYNYHLTPLTAAIKIAIKNAIDSITAGGMTAMGEGLRYGLNDLTSLGDPTHAWAMVLLSDGYQNEGEHPDSVPLVFG